MEVGTKHTPIAHRPDNDRETNKMNETAFVSTMDHTQVPTLYLAHGARLGRSLIPLYLCPLQQEYLLLQDKLGDCMRKARLMKRYMIAPLVHTYRYMPHA